ncbi:MAG: hypothetical protein AMXMBFR64_19840 [Myxococcales bacterium]
MKSERLVALICAVATLLAVSCGGGHDVASDITIPSDTGSGGDGDTLGADATDDSGGAAGDAAIDDTADATSAADAGDSTPSPDSGDSANADTAQPGCGSDADCPATQHCGAGACIDDICAQGTVACKDGDIWECNASGSGETKAADCQGLGCEDAACLGPAWIEIAPLGTDIVAVGQSLTLTATAWDPAGAPVSVPITWASSDPTILDATGAGVVTGLVAGGGDKLAPDGTLVVTATAGGTTESIALQVVQLDQGSGLQFVQVALSADPGSDGRAHYDGVYQTKTSPPVNACNPYGAGPCSWHVADARVFAGADIEVQALGAGKWSSFGKGLLEYPALVNADGLAVAPPAPRPLAITWSSSDPAVAVVEGGFVRGVSPGAATIGATIGPQTWTLDVVVYDQYGYHPTDGFVSGVDPEDGHLVLFSSSAGAAIAGTHDAVRYVDLADYRNLDFRPSQHGPQGVRLVEHLGGTFEKHPGFGCGMVQGAGSVVWLFNGWTAIPFDTATATQVGGLHKVMWRPDGAATGANAVCSGVFVKAGGRDWLIGFDAKPTTYAAFVADVTDLVTGDVTAIGVDDALFTQSPALEFYSPTLWDDGADQWLLFMEQTPKNDATKPNKLRAARLTASGGSLLVEPDTTRTIETAPTPNAPDDQGEAPALIVASAGGAPFVFVGNKDGVTVIDAVAWDIVHMGPAGSIDPALQDLDTRRFGQNIKAFALSPDGATLYALPETSYPVAPFFNTKVEWKNANGATQSTNMTVHRLALIDLTGALPRLMVDPATDPSECFLVAGCTAEQRQYGYDLNLLALKRWMLDTGFAPSTGAILPPQAMNVRQLAVGENAVFLIGRDNPDGVGTALGNLSDVAVIDLATGRMPVFRGWRSDPGKLLGLSDPFGFRVGEGDALLGDARVKNAGVLYVAGPPPAEKAGDGAPHGEDAPMEHTGAYADAPAPASEPGHLLLLSSSHQKASDGTHDVVRRLDLSKADWPEQDFDPATAGAQGKGLTYHVKGETIPWSGGCGVIRGLGSEVWLFNGDAAVRFDTATLTQGTGQVTFDPDPANPTARVCTGALAQVGGKTLLYGVNVDLKPTPLLFVADVTGLSGNVAAAPVTSPFFAPMPGADPYTVRYVQALIHDGELWLLERNDPWNNLRNAVHRAPIGADGSLAFDMSRASDIVAGWTTSGDPGMVLAPVLGTPHLFVGNQGSISVFDVSGPPVRLNYNTDGDGVQDDLDTAWYGRGIQAFAVSPDGARLYALPWEKSGALPHATFTVPLVGGGKAKTTADRYRAVVIDLTKALPVPDPAVNNGNGVDLNWYWFKQLIAASGASPLPPMFPTYRRQLAASAKSLFLVGFDNDDGAGSALANGADVATFDLATGKGHLWRGYEYQGISNAAGLWGYDLGVSGGVDDANLKGGRAKNAGVLFVP